ncbi:hypothetical protein DY000_02053279 [Brassica cretica]|uniref:Large ribosomal subunit protein uL2 RNA-binding domain-containing protein n=1 Tax=Brassica cretica TaxID=69181 RepID=A0ABQ7AFV8_BRACR|nr:hypothetical protein DY000_02053279 [Brassica cretica]
MAIHLYKTSTPSTRNGAVDSQVKSNPRNNLIYGQHHCGKGRNARGIITVRHRGGGHKRLYRKIDFRRNTKDIYGRIVTIEYDPNRNAYICLIHYGDGEKRYILHPRPSSVIAVHKDVCAYMVVVLCTESVVCGLESHTSRSNSPVAHHSFLLFELVEYLDICTDFFSIFSAATLCFFGPPSSLIKDFRSTPEDFTRLPSWIPFQSNIAFRYHEITWYGEKIEEDPTGVSDSIRFGYSISQCDAVFVHSSPDFKPEYLGLLRDLYGKPVFPTGFLLTSTEDEVGDATWVGIKKWLDKQRVSSVVYAALGTEASHRPADLAELAHGLEKSEVPFFWVLRNDSQIPEGFVERIKGRGMVHNGWVPQVKILSHDSVGGFLTHCGWNSLVEGLGVERVPIFFPVLNEQGLNTRLIVKKSLRCHQVDTQILKKSK